MRKIIDGKLYVTEEAEVIFSFTCNYQKPNEYYSAKYLKTQKGAFLYYCESLKDLRLVEETEVKRVIGSKDVDRYIELYGEPERG